MAGLQRSDIDIASIYDCYTITVLMTLEDAGFCGKGEGMEWVTEHDLTFRGTSRSTPPAANCRSARPAWRAACTTWSTAPVR